MYNVWQCLRFYSTKIRQTIRDWESERALQQQFPGVRFESDVQVKSPHLLQIGNNVIIQKGTILHCGGMSWSKGKGGIIIGSHSVISPHCVLYGAGKIEIGQHFECGPGCMIFSSRTDYEKYRRGASDTTHKFDKITIGNHVILFAGCIISPGVTIGDGAVVGAGSVVLSDVPSMSFHAGVPAKSIRAHI